MGNNDEIISQVVERVSTRFEERYNCSMSVLAGCVEILQLAPPEIVRVAVGFGGGIGRSGCACGAVTGGTMALSLKFGSSDPEERAALYEKIRTLYSEFTSRFGTPCCKELNGEDFTSLEHRIRCTSYVREAAAVTARLITG